VAPHVLWESLFSVISGLVSVPLKSGSCIAQLKRVLQKMNTNRNMELSILRVSHSSHSANIAITQPAISQLESGAILMKYRKLVQDVLESQAT
jgi:ribosomal protein S3